MFISFCGLCHNRGNLPRYLARHVKLDAPRSKDLGFKYQLNLAAGLEDREIQRDNQIWNSKYIVVAIASSSVTVEPRPGVLRLMDEAKASGKLLAVCSAATKSSVILCLENLIGMERFKGLDCFLAGEKPDPSIYLTASKKLGVSEKDCLVVEDSVIGLQAATGAGMSCVISYTPSTASQDFSDAIAIYPDLSNVRIHRDDIANWTEPDPIVRGTEYLRIIAV
ncbi:Haloacid dehalogenase-like hydrolase domain-containing protein [Sesamum angolense]|uniref:Haloacid dehalogenase-like hydrolase domain-containing protein n=1 Tax=Sesamum angolense TaxID=2727404 RepID=A0AAE2BQR9_9LAMI|nr:Haloacid dehalogenase-like hydrolase domain-containing protein [Sesamum angolense]